MGRCLEMNMTSGYRSLNPVHSPTVLFQFYTADYKKKNIDRTILNLYVYDFFGQLKVLMS